MIFMVHNDSTISLGVKIKRLILNALKAIMERITAL